MHVDSSDHISTPRSGAPASAPDPGLGLTGVFAAGWVVLTSAQPAYAYIDPGSGGMIVQLLLGGAAGAAILGKLLWHRVRKLIGLDGPEADGAR